MSDAEKPKKMSSSSHERMVKAYLRPCVEAKFERYIQEKGMSKSEAINDAILKLVEPMSPQSKLAPK